MAKKKTRSRKTKKKTAKGAKPKTVSFSVEAITDDQSEALFKQLKPVELLDVSKEVVAARDEIIKQLGLSEPTPAAASEGRANIVGVGCGLKQATGTISAEQVVTVYVEEKLPASRVSADSRIEKDINGIATDVQAVGKVVPQALTNRSRFVKPVPCGVSCGHPEITAGTIGAVVILDDNKQAILSNNHVLANEASGIRDQGGRRIVTFHPGPLDAKALGIKPKDKANIIGALERVEPILLDRPNVIDAAVAHTDMVNLVSSTHRTFKLNPEPMQATLGATVLKEGRTTEATMGTITAVGVMGLKVRYTAGPASFDDQIVIQGVGGNVFSKGGDSGSVIVDFQSKRPIALLFSGSNDNSHTFANPIGAVMKRLGIKEFVAG